MRKEVNEVKCIIYGRVKVDINFRFWCYGSIGHKLLMPPQIPLAAFFFPRCCLPPIPHCCRRCPASWAGWSPNWSTPSLPDLKCPSTFQSWLQHHTTEHKIWLPEQLPKDQMTQPCVANFNQWECEMEEETVLFLPSFLQWTAQRGAVLEKSHSQSEHTCWETPMNLHSLSLSLATVVTHCINFFLASISFFFPTLIPLDLHLPSKGTTLSSLPQVLLSRGPKLRKYIIISRVTIKIIKIRVYNFPTSWGKT